MRRARESLLVLLVLASTGCSRSDGTLVPVDAPAADAPATTAPSDLTSRAASAICGALYRCCDNGRVEYFAPYREHELLKSFRDRLPPAAELDEAGCRVVVKEMLDVVPLGDWARAAEAGAVTLDLPAFDACVATLSTAACGAPVRDALWDSTCLGFAPPAGGEEQRSFVKRTGKVGDTCSPIRDGLGGTFYGTCDPTAAFCCFAEPGVAGCQLPFASGGVARPGQCAAVAGVDQACSVALPLLLCATGNDCSSETATCVAPSTDTLAQGATCIDNSWHLLGDCQDTWCDVLGTKKCEPLRDDGDSCSGPEECRSGKCESVCKPLDLCGGAPPPTSVDAGVPDAPPGASTDAATSVAGETCAGAASLASASTTSPVTGYVSRVTGSFGASNDYNPLDTSGLPPACSIVYDATGLEVVYAITLAPGERLRARAVLADGKQPALYLLDSCPGATWPDFDASTRCGSNEYNVGFCGVAGCDPAVLDIRYPTSLSGQPTSSRTFWLVIDQVAGSASTGFILDWSIVSA